MPTEFEQSPEIENAINAMMAETRYSEFEALRDHEVELAACLKIKMNSDDEVVPVKGPAAQLVKVPEMFKLFTNKAYVIAVDAYFWQHGDTNKKKSALHKALMQIEVLVDAEGTVKLKKRKPEINEFGATLVRFGPSEEMERIMPALVEAGQRLLATMSVGEPMDQSDETLALPPPRPTRDRDDRPPQPDRRHG